MRTRQQIAADASAASARAARRRRFQRYAEEMRAHPDDLDDVAKEDLAVAMHEAGGWRVFQDH